MSIDYTNTDFYLGPTRSCYIGYSKNQRIRKDAASGGFISSFLMFLLENKFIDGAFVSRTIIKDKEIEAYSYIAKSKQEILDSRTSIYMHFPYLRGLKEIKNQDIKIAVVGLPCHLSAIQRMEEKIHWLKDKITLKIGIFCSHASSPSLVHRVLKKEGINLDLVDKFYFRKGHWRGFLTFQMKDGQTIQVPYLNFGLYMNLYFHERPSCLSCMDHTAISSDISCGDAWMKRLKKHPIKHSMVVVRNHKAGKLFAAFCDRDYFHAEKIPPSLVIKLQKSGLIRKNHYIYAFKKLSPLFKYRVSYNGANYANWNHFIGAFLLMLNVKASENPKLMDIIYRLPRILLYGYVAVIKAFMKF